MTSTKPSSPAHSILVATENIAPSDAMETKIRSFPEIMKEFKNKFPVEPQGRVDKGSSIRSKTSWREVLLVLDDAAAAYAVKAGLKGALKRVKAFIEDQADTIERVSSLVPDVDYAKPIVGTLTFLLQVRSSRMLCSR